MKRKDFFLSAFTALIIFLSTLLIASGCSNGGGSTIQSYWPDGSAGTTGVHAWQPNERVDDDTGATKADYASIAVDSSGNAYVVWQDNRNGNNDIYFSYRPSGGAWQANVRVDDAPGATETFSPSIAVDSSGNTYAVWWDNRNGNYDIYFSFRPSGGTWQPNVRVDDDTGATDAMIPGIAVDSSGNAYAVWQDNRNGDADVYFSYRPSGGAWQPNVRIDDATESTDADYASIAVDSSGTAYAVWRDNRNGNYDIYFSCCLSGSAWQPNVRVDDATGATDACRPRIAVDSSGSAYGVWYDIRNGNWDIYSSNCPSGGAWQSNVRVDDATGSTDAYNPSIAVDPLGNAYAIWYDYRYGNWDIYFSYCPSAGLWQANIRVDDATGSTDAGTPSIAVDSSGNAYAVWMDLRNGNYDIYFSLYQ